MSSCSCHWLSHGRIASFAALYGLSSKQTQVGRLAKQLPKGDVSAMAATLGVKNFTIIADDGDEDDLT